MKQFFEEYGGVSLGILAVLVLIAIVSPVGGKIKGSLKEVTKGFDDKMKNGMNSSGIGFGGSSGGGSTETTPIETLEASKEIEIEGKKYTVIECNGTQCKLLASELAIGGASKRFDASSNNYVTSEIAAYLDKNYFNTLPELIKNAIVETPIQQKVASSVGVGNNPTWTSETKDVGNHKVFLPSWDELTKAARSTDKETLQTFLNSKYVWLRDTYSRYVLNVSGSGGLSNHDPYDNNYVRPAFVLDLSKVEYTTK